MAQRSFHWIMLAALLGWCGACSDDATDDGEVVEEVADVVYLEGATDEALLTLLSNDPIDEAERRVELQLPEADEPLSADAAPTFVWTYAATTGLAPGPRGPEASPWLRWVERVVDVFSPIATAHAHGTPYNGTAYFLVFADEEGEPLLRVFKANPIFSMSTELWATLSETSGPVTLSILSADFENNLLSQGGGPFEGGSFEFEIER